MIARWEARDGGAQWLTTDLTDVGSVRPAKVGGFEWRLYSPAGARIGTGVRATVGAAKRELIEKAAESWGELEVVG